MVFIMFDQATILLLRMFQSLPNRSESGNGITTNSSKMLILHTFFGGYATGFARRDSRIVIILLKVLLFHPSGIAAMYGVLTRFRLSGISFTFIAPAV